MNKKVIITALLAFILILVSCHQSAQKTGTEKQEDSTTAQYIFLILQDDLRYDDETIATILDLKRPSVRSMRSRIKGKVS